MKSLSKVALGVALSALTLYLFLRNLDFGAVREGVLGASLPLLLLAIVVGYFGHLASRSLRWATMLTPLKRKVSFYNLFSTTAEGYAVSWLAPGRLGEIVRPVLLGRREGIAIPSLLGIAALERILDSVAVLVLAAAAALAAPLWWDRAGSGVVVHAPGLGETPLVSLLAWLGAAGLALSAVGAVAARILLRRGSRLHAALDRRASAGGGRVSLAVWGFAQSLARGADFLQDAPRALRVAAESLLIWTIIALGTWIGLLAADVRIPFAGVFLLMVLSVIGIAVPTPGGAGSVHVAFQWGLTGLFGVETNRAAAATVLYHPVIIYIPPVIFGLLFAWKDGLGPRTLGRLARSGGRPDGPGGADERGAPPREEETAR